MRVLIAGVDTLALSCLHAAFALNDIVSIDCEIDDVVQWAKLDDVDAVVINPHAEHGRGIDAVHRLRAARLSTAVLLHGVHAPVGDVVKWMEVADDCLHGLCDPREVVAKLRAIVRRQHGQTTDHITVGAVTVNSAGQQVLVEDRPVHLSRSELRILELLMLRAGRCCPKHTILDHLYSALEQPDQKIVDVVICKIRKKMTAAGAPPDLIQTVWGRGYMINKPMCGAERKLAA